MPTKYMPEFNREAIRLMADEATLGYLSLYEAERSHNPHTT